MITEKTIETYKYFTCGLQDLWILRSVATHRVATLERVDKVGTEGVITTCVELGVDTRATWIPVPLPAVCCQAIDEIEKASPAEPVAPKAKPGKNRVKASKYFGVSGGKPTGGGDERWRAKLWDGKNKKTLNLGTFNSEEVAAAAIQQQLGNTDEAARLRKPHLGKENAVTTAAWDCNTCGHRNEGRAKPSKCESCGKESFTRILPDGRGASDYVRESPDE